MAVTIVDVNSTTFSINGVEYLKNFMSVVETDNVKILNVYDSRVVLQTATNFADYTVGGSSFASAILLQSALKDILFNRDMSGFESRIENLEQNQVTGVETYDELTDLPGTGTLLVSYKVTNDTVSSSNNGYYHWDGAAYVKDADLVQNVIDDANTSEGVSGVAVYEFGKDKDSPITYLVEGNLTKIHDTESGVLNVSTGEVLASGTHELTGYIRLKPNTTYYFSGIWNSCLYELDKTFTRNIVKTLTEFTTTADEKYMRLSATIANLPLVILSEGSNLKDRASIRTKFLEKDRLKFEDINEKYIETVYTGCTKVPSDLLSRTEMTVDFDFTPNFDINAQTQQYDLFGFGTGISQAGGDSDPNRRYSVSLQSKPTTGGIFNPDTTAYYKVRQGTLNNTTVIESGTIAPHSTYLRDAMSGEDLFSFRKLTPVIGDYGTKFSIDGTNFTLEDGGGVLYTTALALYTTVEDLVLVLQADAAFTDYEFILYGGRRLITELQYVADVAVVAKNLTTVLPDAFPCYVQRSSIGVKRHFRFSIKRNEANKKQAWAMSLVDGHPLHYVNLITSNSNWDFEDEHMVFGGFTDAIANKFDGTIENIVINRNYTLPKTVAMLATHNITEGFTVANELDTSLLDKLVEDAKQNGYSIVNADDFLNNINSKASYDDLPQKSLLMSYDDSRWDVYDNIEHRNTLKKLGVKPLLNIPMSRIIGDTSAKASLRLAHSLGWTIAVHGYTHIDYNILSYAELQVEMTGIETATGELEIACDIFAYPMSSHSRNTQKVLKNENGFAIQISYTGANFYGGSEVLFRRDWVFDDIANSGIYQDEIDQSYGKTEESNRMTNWSLS